MTGTEWLVDAYGCEPSRLQSRSTLEGLFERAVRELSLRPVSPAQWHCFPDPGGVTGLLLLSESHLTIHTFPESGYASLNLYCCRPRARWAFEERLAEALGASRVLVREVPRGLLPADAAAPSSTRNAGGAS